jgi:flagellar basal body rod protein FlgC
MAKTMWGYDIREKLGRGGMAVIACIGIAAMAGCLADGAAITPTPTGARALPAGGEVPTLVPTPANTPTDEPAETVLPATQIASPIATTAAPTETPTPAGQPTMQQVVFPPGGTSAVLEGRIAPPARHTYVFRALAGQSATLEITSESSAANFSFSGMTDGQPYKRLENEDRSWQGVLPLTQDYLLTVASLDETDYALSLVIEPLPTPTLIPTVDTLEPVPTRIQFEPGAISAAVSGTVVPPERHFYVFRALAGQAATIEITSADAAANFSLVGLEDGQPYKRLENEDRFWAGTLPLAGDYLIGVAVAAGQSDYTLTLTIEP